MLSATKLSEAAFRADAHRVIFAPSRPELQGVILRSASKERALPK